MSMLIAAGWWTFCVVTWVMLMIVSLLVVSFVWVKLHPDVAERIKNSEDLPPEAGVKMAYLVLYVWACDAFVMAAVARLLCGNWGWGAPFVLVGLYVLWLAFSIWNGRRKKRQPKGLAGKVYDLGHRLAVGPA